jgi:hypothetical protein
MRAAILLSVLLAACSKPSSSAPPHNFELHCASSDTDKESRLFCLRIDSRSGEVVRVDHAALPTSNGPTVGPVGPSGTYALACDATVTTTRSDLYCVRLHRGTGEMLLIGLPSLPTIPAGAR